MFKSPACTAYLLICTFCRSDVMKITLKPCKGETLPVLTCFKSFITIINEDHVKIEHDEIPGFMNAMTMNFEVRDPSLLQDLEPGMEVRFRVAVADRDVHIDQIERGERAGK